MEVNLIINGNSVKGNRKIEVRNPASPDELVGICNAADAKQAEEAIEAAWKAYPAWRNLGITGRVKVLEKAAGQMEKVWADWPSLLTREQGKVLFESTDECQFAAAILHTSSDLAPQLTAEEEVIREEGGWWMVRKDPIGVVSVITPWNYPIILTWLPIQQALLAGNTVVVKPASYTPLTIAKTIEAVADLFPPGVINFVPGSGSEVGDVLTTHPLVRKIAFTGSVEIGIDITREASSTLKNVSMELGGNDAAIILDDFDLTESALERLLWGVYLTSGQVCMAIKRIYVHESLYKKFVESFIQIASEIVVGNGLDPRVTMGPLNNKDQLERIKDLVKDTKDRGANVFQVGKKLDEKTFEKGYFHLPTIVTGVDGSYRIVKEEQFGPIIPIMSFRTNEEAIQLANDTIFGLGSSVWTADEERGLRVAKQLEAGYTMINNHSVGALELFAPFGGQKQSGIGRSWGLEGLLSCTESHTIVSKWM